MNLLLLGSLLCFPRRETPALGLLLLQSGNSLAVPTCTRSACSLGFVIGDSESGYLGVWARFPQKQINQKKGGGAQWVTGAISP